MKRQKPYLEKIFTDSEFKYYFLGYFLGDGCVNENNIQIDSTDYQIIRDFAEELNLNVYKKSSTSSYRIVIQSKELIEYLDGLGIGRRKSFEGIRKKIEIPDKYKFDFLRGLIDSDGSIGRGGKKENPAPDVRFMIKKDGFEEETIDELIEVLNLKFSKSIIDKKSYSKPMLGYRLSRKSLESFNKNYKNKTIYLERKNEEFNKWFECWNKYNHYGSR